MARQPKVSALTGEHVIAAILEQMHEGLHPMKYSVLVPGVYRVYLHYDDWVRLETFFGEIKAEASHGLDEALAQLNAKGGILRKKDRRRYETREGSWQIEFYENTDHAARSGVPVVRSALKSARRPTWQGLPGETEPVSKEPAEHREHSAEPQLDEQTHASNERVFARIAFIDKRGQRTYKMTSEQITIGRDASKNDADLRLFTDSEVSRKHVLVRRAKDGQFFIKDLSDFGTTVNGNAVRPSVERKSGVKRDLNAEFLLPPKSRIGLAGKIFLDFDAVNEK